MRIKGWLPRLPWLWRGGGRVPSMRLLACLPFRPPHSLALCSLRSYPRITALTGRQPFYSERPREEQRFWGKRSHRVCFHTWQSTHQTRDVSLDMYEMKFGRTPKVTNLSTHPAETATAVKVFGGEGEGEICDNSGGTFFPRIGRRRTRPRERSGGPHLTRMEGRKGRAGFWRLEETFRAFGRRHRRGN